MINYLPQNTLIDEKVLSGICDKVVALDPSIRFAGISRCRWKVRGNCRPKRPQCVAYLRERAQYAITAATRQYTRLDGNIF